MTRPESGLTARAVAWRDADPDPATRAELDGLLASGDTAALADRFDGSLAFGTAGIRAELGAGPMRMNRLVTARVAAGLAGHIAASEHGEAAAVGIVIGHDARNGSAVFATDAARILSRAGIRVALLPGPLPTPVLAFAVRHHHAAYGLMVTASHNPRQDNGIKVYVRDGGQLLPPDDERIAAAIDEVDPLRLPAGWAEGPFEFTPADDAARAYVTAVAAGGRRPPGAPGLTVVHTALHGVGDATLRAVLAAAGWPDPVPVAAQREPDPAFPTVPYPNPEAPGVLDLARETAEAAGADLVLANDPDADRLAVMVPGPDGWRALTGDELGALLGDAVLNGLAGGMPTGLPGGVFPADASGGMLTGQAGGVFPADASGGMLTGQAGGVLPADASGGPVAGAGQPVAGQPVAGQPVAGPRPPVVATTVVSGSLLRRIAQAAGVRCVTTLTGFKWIARAGGTDGTLVYGYEQALGYAVRPDLVADKDGISAALLALRLATELAGQDRTLTDRLDELALTHGVHVTRERSLRAEGPTGLARLAEAVARVRKESPRLLDGQPVTVTDLRDGAGGLADLAGGLAERAPGQAVPPADVLIWHVGGDARVMVRPSGTEPVLKLYAEAVRPARSRDELAAARAAATEHTQRLLAAAAALLDPGTGKA